MSDMFYVIYKENVTRMISEECNNFCFSTLRNTLEKSNGNAFLIVCMVIIVNIVFPHFIFTLINSKLLWVRG